MLITYSERLILGCPNIKLENASILLAFEVSYPQRACRCHKLVFYVQVPILVVAVQLEVLALSHIVHCDYAVILLRRMVLKSKHRVWNHLLKMVHFVYVLSLVPNSIRLVDEDKVLVLRVNHLADVIPVHVLEENENLHDVGCVRRSSD